jgi:hypothetical protein
MPVCKPKNSPIVQANAVRPIMRIYALQSYSCSFSSSPFQLRSLSKNLEKQRSTKHTNSRQRTPSHSRRRSSRTLRSRTAGGARRRTSVRRSSNFNAVASRRLHTSRRACGHCSRNDRAGRSRSFATRPSRPRRIARPTSTRPAAPRARGAIAAAPPGGPGAGGPGA